MNEIQEQIKYEIQKYKATEAVLADLRKKYENTVFDVASTKGMVEARKARAEIRDWRVDLEKERQSFKAVLIKRGRDIDSEAKRLTAELVKLEDPIDLQIQAEENRKEAEKAAKVEAERVRVAQIQEWIGDIRNLVVQAANKTSKEISSLLEGLKAAVEIGEDFQEFRQEAQEAKETVITLLESLYADTVAKEEEQARIVAERAELARLRAEQEAREREIAQKHFDDEKKARIEREAEEKRITAERDKLEADRKAEEKRISDQKKAEEKRMADVRAIEEKRIADARKAEESRLSEERWVHEAKIRAEQEEADLKRKEQDRIEAENTRQKAALERQRQEQEEQARLLSERRQRLTEARRGSHTQALQDILALAEDYSNHPNHQKVRDEVALIAEASLEKLSARKKAA
jgi:colicin import membrane protein